jgi:arsenite/tail-anchored protein-transporting ATPase
MEILFFTGKGGVGKSSLAAATAWQLAQSHRVRIVSLDPAHNLGDIFGLSLKKKRFFTDRLCLEEVDLQKRTRDYLKREIKVFNETYKYLQVLNLDTYFSVLKYSPGIEEYALLSSIEEIINSTDASDYVIFDTPPTGLTLRFLALARVTVTWIDRLIGIRRKILEKCHTIHRLCGPLSQEETLLSFDEADDRILQRLVDLRRNYRDLDAVLQGPTCRIAAVFNPDLLSLHETERLIQALKELNLPLSLLIDNKIGDGNHAMADRVEARVRQLSDAPVMRVPFSDTLADGRAGKLYEVDADLTAWFAGGAARPGAERQ